MELDIKMLEYEISEKRRMKEQKVNDLRQKIQKNMEEERDILSRISAIEDGSYYSPLKAATLESENDQLAISAQALEHEIEFKKRELDILDKKRLLVAKSRGVVANKKLEERNQLRKEVDLLKSKIDELNIALEESLTKKIQRETILRDFVHIQKENDELRTQLSDLERDLNSGRN